MIDQCFLMPPEGALAHQGSGGFSVGFDQIDLVALLLLPPFLPPSAAALDADTQAADDNQQGGGHEDGVDRPPRHCTRQHAHFSTQTRGNIAPARTSGGVISPRGINSSGNNDPTLQKCYVRL